MALNAKDLLIVKHSTTLIDRMMHMIDGYIAELELDRQLGQEATEKLIYCVYTGVFMIYLRQLYMLNGTKGIQTFMKLLNKECEEIFKEEHTR